MGKRRGKVPPVEPAEIGQSRNAFHDLKQLFCAVLAEELAHLFSLESIVVINPLLTVAVIQENHQK
jgi:hypothetical protein